jgi:hypothetical protein
MLLNDVMKGEGKWTVRTDGLDCPVQGVMVPVTDALEKLSDRLVETLTGKVKIREAAIRRGIRQGQPVFERPTSPESLSPPTLSFRASLEDENRNQVLEGGEKVVVRVEVSNSGPGVARGAAIVLSGTPALVKEFTTPTMLGDLQPGEKKQVAINATLPAVLAEQQAELIVQVTETTGFGVPTRKRFVAMIQPGRHARAGGEPIEVLSVDVDQVPARAEGFERRTSYAVVVGIEAYREEGVPHVTYAKRDADIVAKHLTAVAGFPAANVQVLTDERALLVDLHDAFEDWLPRMASSSGILFVYLVGHAVLTADGSDIIIVPYEGRLDLTRRGYSLKRLQERLSRLPSRLNLMFADLSLPVVNEQAGAGPRSLPWGSQTRGSKGRTVVVGSSATNGPSLAWDAGQHGLFTYHCLKAIRGHGDANGNGWVEVGEILAYLWAQVPAGAAELTQEQTPVVVPAVETDGPIGTFPVSKARHPGS